jgi:hypothetical protein
MVTRATRACYPVHHPRHRGAAWHGGGRPRSFPAKSMAPVPLAMTGRKSKPPSGEVTAIRGGAVTLAEAADAFLSSPRAASPNTRRAYARRDRPPGRRARRAPAARRCAGRRGRRRAAPPLGQARSVDMEPQPGGCCPGLNWCADRKRWPAPAAARRRRAAQGACRPHQGAARASIERLLSRREIPLRERRCGGCCTRASEILQ